MKRVLHIVWIATAMLSFTAFAASSIVWMRSHLAHDRMVVNLHRRSIELEPWRGAAYWDDTTGGEYNRTLSLFLTLNVHDPLPAEYAPMRPAHPLGLWPPGTLLQQTSRTQTRAGWTPLWMITAVAALLPAGCVLRRAVRRQQQRGPPGVPRLRNRASSIARWGRRGTIAASLAACALIAALWAASAGWYEWDLCWSTTGVRYDLAAPLRSCFISVSTTAKSATRERQFSFYGYQLARPRPSGDQFKLRLFSAFASEPIFKPADPFDPTAAATQVGHEFRLPYWGLLLLAGVVMLWINARWVRRRVLARRRRARGLCSSCGYDVRANRTQCPECGAAIPQDARS